MEQVAQMLRQARERRGMSLEEAAQRTRIPLDYLMLMEEAPANEKRRTRLLADPLYLIPYVRDYAAFLNLDSTIVVTQFTNTLLDAQEKSMKITPAEHPSQLWKSSSQRSRAISLSIVLASVLVTLAVIGQYSDMTARPPGVGSDRPLSPTDSVAIPSPPPPPTASISTPTPPAPVVSQPAETPSSPSQDTPPQSMPALTTAREQQPMSENAHFLRIEAKETTWIRVLIEGQPSKELILRPGQSATWTSTTTFQVTLGNAGGVTLNLDGQELPPFGKSGQVLRNIRLPFAKTESQQG